MRAKQDVTAEHVEIPQPVRRVSRLTVGAVHDQAEHDADVLAEQALSVAREYERPRDTGAREHRAAQGTEPGVDGDVGTIRRFPNTALSAPVAWSQLTGNVFRPGEGASGGVYILTTNDPNALVRKVVVKPVFGKTGIGTESPEQLAYGDLALAKLFGIRAPKSRMVKPGPEFAELVNVCKPYQPAKDPEDEYWKPLEAAQGFVVMSEVPNATSIASLADKAPTDQKASVDLTSTIFDPVFLSELGRLCMADLMLGNDDRIMLGAMNLGNLMLSMGERGGQLYAIDTTAKLPKVPSPETIASKGGPQGGGFFNLKKQIDQGAAQVCDDFFDQLAQRVERNTPAPTNPDPPPPLHQLIRDRYRNGRDRYVASFEFGWQDIMIRALDLTSKRGDKELQESVGGLEHGEVGLGSLRTTMAYVGNRAGGESHEDSIGRPLAVAFVNLARETDRMRLAPNTTDILGPNPFVAPERKAMQADYEHIPGLPRQPDINGTVPRKGITPLRSGEYEALQGMPNRISVARGQVDVKIGATKKKGLPGRRTEVPRNRSLLGHAVVDGVALAVGANRLSDSLAYVSSVLDEMKPVFSAKFTPDEAYTVAAFLDDVATNQLALRNYVGSYRAQAAAARQALAQNKSPVVAEYTNTLKMTDTLLTKADAGAVEAAKQNPRQMANILRRSNRGA